MSSIARVTICPNIPATGLVYSYCLGENFYNTQALKTVLVGMINYIVTLTAAILILTAYYLSSDTFGEVRDNLEAISYTRNSAVRSLAACPRSTIISCVILGEFHNLSFYLLRYHFYEFY